VIEPAYVPAYLFREALHIVGDNDLCRVGFADGLQILQAAFQPVARELALCCSTLRRLDLNQAPCLEMPFLVRGAPEALIMKRENR